MQLSAEQFEQIVASLRNNAGSSLRLHERRTSARAGLRARVTLVPCSAAPQPRLVWLRDLAAGGISFVCPEPLDAGSFVVVSMPREDGSLFNLLYVVVRCRRAGAAQYLCGARLERVVSQEQEAA